MKRISAITTILIYLLLINILIKIIDSHFFMVSGYNNFGVANISIIIFNTILCVIASLILPIKSLRPSEMILWAVYFMHYVPSIIVYSYLSNQDILWPFIITITFMSIASLSKITILNFKIVTKIKVIKGHIPTILLGILFLSFIIQEHGFNISPPNITDVYGVRASYKANLSWLGGYIVVIAGFSIAPFLMLLSWYFLKERHVICIPMAIVSLLISYSIYTASGLKSVAFSSITTLFFYIFLKKFKSAGFFLIISFTCILIFSLVLYFVYDIEIITIHWLRRILIVPGINVSYYYEYFNILKTPWDNAPNVISILYYNTHGSANAGLFGDAISQYGWPGLIINSLIFLSILKLADISAKNVDKAFASALFFMSAYALSNSATTTIFITYGFISNIILLKLFSSKIK